MSTAIICGGALSGLRQYASLKKLAEQEARDIIAGRQSLSDTAEDVGGLKPPPEGVAGLLSGGSDPLSVPETRDEKRRRLEREAAEAASLGMAVGAGRGRGREPRFHRVERGV